MEPVKIEDIKRLITAFYDAEITVEEEQKLFLYFKGNNIAEELKGEQQIFLQFYDAPNIEAPHLMTDKLDKLIDRLAEKETERIQTKKKHLWIWGVSSAACIAALLVLGWYFYTPFQKESPNIFTQQATLKDTYTNPEQAYAEAQKALALVSANFNKGMNQLHLAASQIESTNKKVEKAIKRN